MTLNDADTIERTSSTSVHVVGATAGTHVGEVRQVGEGDVAVGRRRSTANEGGVTVEVVPSAPVRRARVEAVRVRAGRRDDDVLGRSVLGGSGVAEVSRSSDCFSGQRVPGGLADRGNRVVVPHTSQGTTGWIANVRCARGARGRAVRHTVAVLGHDARPAFAVGAETGEHGLEARCHSGGIAGEVGVAVAVGGLGAPLGAVEDDVDLGSASRDLDAVNAAVGGHHRSSRLSRLADCIGGNRGLRGPMCLHGRDRQETDLVVRLGASDCGTGRKGSSGDPSHDGGQSEGRRHDL